jgi:hypothetical protein
MDEQLHGLERELGALEGFCVSGGFLGAQRCLTSIEVELNAWLAPGAKGPSRTIADETFWRLFEHLRESVLSHDPDQVASAASDLRFALSSYQQTRAA